ncbi:hypothetical protein AC804_10900 [Chryseobacterium sp. Hurlbut01]|nr:hypothetical protein AC804_10900 [Chryseobacterium sp. Hurlbut01]
MYEKFTAKLKKISQMIKFSLIEKCTFFWRKVTILYFNEFKQRLKKLSFLELISKNCLLSQSLKKVSNHF